MFHREKSHERDTKVEKVRTEAADRRADSLDTRENQEKRVDVAPSKVELAPAKPDLLELLRRVSMTFRKTDNGLYTDLWQDVDRAIVAHGGVSPATPATVTLPGAPTPPGTAPQAEPQRPPVP